MAAPRWGLFAVLGLGAVLAAGAYAVVPRSCGFEPRPDQLAICGYVFERDDEDSVIRVVEASDRNWVWGDISLRMNHSGIRFGFSSDPVGNFQESIQHVRYPLGELRDQPIRFGDTLTFCDTRGSGKVVFIEVERVPPGTTAAGTGFSNLRPC